ncbi:MAG: alkaline phosphatase family protein [Flavobacteriales bacterium]|nr:alkaline phosphatase family protein [Flavobacteriales bacterium]
MSSIKFFITLFLLLVCHGAFSQKEVVHKICFGSCAKASKKQPILSLAARESPDLFIYLGDNIYGNTRDMDKLKSKYLKLGKKAEFQELNDSTTVLATWDDHDYGENDAGRHFSRKRESREIFLEFWKEPETSERRKHKGIYHSLMHGPQGKRLQVILLDTRTFRDNLTKLVDKKRYKNDYQPCQIADSTMLGVEQWTWLEKQLKKPAEIRIIASSNQFSHEYNGWESWTNLPHEQQKMLDLIKSTKANGVVFLSGDVHWGEISKMEMEGLYPIYDITSSGITQTWNKPESNKNRIGAVVMDNNYGVIEIDWEREAPELLFYIKDNKGEERVKMQVNLSELQFKP